MRFYFYWTVKFKIFFTTEQFKVNKTNKQTNKQTQLNTRTNTQSDTHTNKHTHKQTHEIKHNFNFRLLTVKYLRQNSPESILKDCIPLFEISLFQQKN